MLTGTAALCSSLQPFVELSAEAIKWPQLSLVHCDDGFSRAVLLCQWLWLLACFCHLGFSVHPTMGAPRVNWVLSVFLAADCR